MTIERYRLSFTTGGIFLQEAPLVAERYLALRDWTQTRAEIRSQNLLQVRTASAALRLSKELVARLECLEVPELEELREASLRDRGYPRSPHTNSKPANPASARKAHSWRSCISSSAASIFSSSPSTLDKGFASGRLDDAVLIRRHVASGGNRLQGAEPHTQKA